jgi:starch phosphorylase
VLNLSTLDGWWDEAWRANNRTTPIGWAIGAGETYNDREYQDQVESVALYEQLETDVVPGFYERSADGLPRRWIASMKASVAELCCSFSTHRMVREYTERFYLKAEERYRKLAADGGAPARNLAAWKARVERAWPQVRVEKADASFPGQATVAGEFTARVRVRLGELSPDDVLVQLYTGRVDPNGDLVDAKTFPMQPASGGDQ